jgi:predicted aspartyl protease
VRFPAYKLVLALLALSVSRQVFATTSVPVKYCDGMVWLKVEVPGKQTPLNFLLDSGAGSSVVDLATARQLGLKLGSTQTVQGVHTEGMGYRVNSFAGKLVGIPVPERMLALDLSAVSRRCHQKIDGLLGTDFFRGRTVEIDYANEKIRLLARNEARFAGGVLLPMVIRNDAMCIKVSIDGQPADWARVDTGCNSALEWVESGAIAPGFSKTSVATMSGSARHRSADVQLGSHQLRGVTIGVHTERIFAGEAGLLGNGILSRFKVTFDVDGRRLLVAAR